jgi:hypothetical protein
MKVDGKLTELVPLSHKFAKQSRVAIFRNERNRSTPFGQKLIFWPFLTVSLLHEIRCTTDRTGAILAEVR